MKRIGFLTILTVFVIALAFQMIPAQAYPVSGYSKIYEGIEYATGMATSPRLMRAWAVRVNLMNPDVSMFASPGNGGAPYDTTLQGTDAFVSQYGPKVATNACHWDVNTPAPYADVLGLLISNGNLISSAGGIWPTQLNFTIDKYVYVAASNDPPVGVYTGIETGPLVLYNGVVQPYAPAINPYTGFGISQDGKRLIMVCVDGRQPGWSDGCTYAELGQWLLDFGAWNGVHADGGGSTCMVRQDIGVCNRPCYGYVRPVAVNLGVGSTPGNRVGPDVCAMNANRRDLVFRGNMNHIYQRTYTSTGGWAAPVDLGVATYESPAICSRADGYLDVFQVSTDNHAWWKSWTTGGGWGAWTQIPGYVVSNPTVCSRNVNNMELFYRSDDNATWRIAYNNGSWGAWETLGGACKWGPGCAIAGDGSLNVFVCGSDSKLYQKILPVNGVWTGWLLVGGSITIDGTPTACRRDATHMDVFVRGSDFAMKHITYTTGSGWGNWESLGGSVGKIAVCAPNSTTLETFHRGLSDELWARYWTSSTGWLGWSYIGNYFY